MTREKTEPGNKEKALVALAAAIGAGCRHCADRLYPMAREAGATSEEIQKAFREALEVRETATAIMRRKAETLLGHRISEEETAAPGETPWLPALTKLSAALAANAAPDAVRHLESARFSGAPEAGIKVVMGIARKVRSKAQAFSDEEIDQQQVESTPPEEIACPEETVAAGQGSGPDTCCPETDNAAAESCSCATGSPIP